MDGEQAEKFLSSVLCKQREAFNGSEYRRVRMYTFQEDGLRRAWPWETEMQVLYP